MIEKTQRNVKKVLHYPRLDTVLNVEYLIKVATEPLSKNEIDRSLRDLKSAEGILEISQDNAEFFTFEGVIDANNGYYINISIKWLENEKKIFV